MIQGRCRSLVVPCGYFALAMLAAGCSPAVGYINGPWSGDGAVGAVDVPWPTDRPTVAVDVPPSVRDAGPTLTDVPTLVDTGTDAGTGPMDAGNGQADTGTPGTDVPAVDVGPLPDAGPALPALDSATVAHVRAIRAAGMARGNRLNVFTKLGDSISESGSFLQDVGHGWYTLGDYSALDPTIQYFSAVMLPGGDNSFSRASECAMGGWATTDALASGAVALHNELMHTRPGYAIVMFGTNDLDRGPVTDFHTNLSQILQIVEDFGTVPVLSTIPDRTDSPAKGPLAIQFGAEVRAIAAARHLPLIDYWAALQSLPRRGISDDGIHPNVEYAMGTTQPGDFTAAGLPFGYNVRNLTAIQMLDRLRNLP